MVFSLRRYFISSRVLSTRCLLLPVVFPQPPRYRSRIRQNAGKRKPKDTPPAFLANAASKPKRGREEGQRRFSRKRQSRLFSVTLTLDISAQRSGEDKKTGHRDTD